MSTAALQRCVLCGAVATYVITTGTETVAACAAELGTFIDAGLDSMGEPFVVVRRAQGQPVRYPHGAGRSTEAAVTTSKDATAAAITGAQVIDAATTAEDIEARKQSMWHERARRLLEQALAELDDIDSIPTVTAALAAMRIEVGELPADEMDGYPFPGEDDSDEGCTCPPDLVARGGWSSRCPVHGGGLCAY